MQYMDIAKGLGIEKIIDDYWDTPVPRKDLAETIVLTQQSKVLHREEEFWTDHIVFVRRMLPIARAYQKEVKNLIGICAHISDPSITGIYAMRSLAKETRSDGREEALKVKGALGLSWTEMARLPELRDACRTTLISKTGYLSPSSLNEKRFVKLLVDYYAPEKIPELPLQSLYYALLYLVHQRGTRVEASCDLFD